MQLNSIAQPNNLIFDHYTTNEGLSDNTCQTVVQDDDNFIWIGTANGLNRFDGKEFVKFYGNGSVHQLPGNLINKLLCLPGHRLAVATNNGLAILNTRSGMVQQLLVPSLPELKAITNMAADIVIDKKGNIILGTSAGVYIFNASLQLVFRYDAYTPQNIGNTRLLFLAENALNLLPDGDVLIRGNFGFIYVLNVAKKTFRNIKDIPGNQFDLLKHWYGKINVLWGYNGKGQFFFIKYPNATVRSVDSIFIIDLTRRITSFVPLPFSAKKEIHWTSKINFLNDSTFSISTQSHNGIYLFKFDNKTLSAHFIKKALQGTFCIDIIADKNNRTWAATDNGLFKQSFNKAIFNNIFPPPLVSITGEDKTVNHIIHYQKKYFVTQYGIGVLVYDDNLQFIKSISFTKQHMGNWPWNLSHYSNDTLLIANGVGALLLNTIDFTLKKFWQPGMPKVVDSFAITTSFIDSHQQLWMGIGNGNGVFTINVSSHKWKYFSPKSPGAIFKLRYPQSIAEDRNGNIWMGSPEGITRWNQQKQTFDTLIKKFPGLSDNSTIQNAITSDADNNLWVLIPDLVLIKWNLNTQKITYFRRPDNIPPLRAEFISGPWANCLWMKTNKGLLSFNIITNHFNLITKSDGLYDDDIRGNLDFDNETNRFFIGFTDEFTWLKPSDVFKEKNTIEAVITDVRNIGDSISMAGDSSISFSYKNNSFIIGFTGINYNDGEKNTYAYRLFKDKPGAFINIGQQKTITFVSVNPGRYIFQVKVILSDGTESIIPATLHINISFPFYETWWFYLLCSIIIAAVIYLLYRYRINQFVKLQKMRNRIASDLHDDIGSSLSGISIMSELAKSKSPEALYLLDSIEKNATIIQENMNDIVWAINPKNDHFQNILQRMNAFAREMLEAKNIEFAFVNDDSLDHLKLIMEQRKNLYLFFKEAINNAAKYSGAKKVTVTILQQNKFIEMKVCDEGKGFDTAKNFNGNGMNTMQKRAEEMNGSVEIISAINKGTTIHLKFKIT